MLIPNYVEYIMMHLQENGFNSYFVGGGVRDIFNNKTPHDYDIVTSATPDQVKKLFSKVVPVGEKFGTVIILMQNERIEVTTMRKEEEYKDNRHPEKIIFTTDLQEDVARRDFTINSIAIDLEGNVYDYYGGLKDIENKIIRAVRNPNDRFTEDALRMMRAVRFSAQHDFDIEGKTERSIRKNAYLIQAISKERIRDELCKILMSDYPGYGIEMLQRCGLLEFIIPELCECVDFNQYNIHHDKNVFDHIISVINNTPKILNVRLAALLHDVAKPKCFSVDEEENGHFYGHHLDSAIMAEEILKRLKFDNKTIESVVILVKEHMSRYDFLRVTSIKKFINRVGIDNLNDLFELQIADIKGSAPPHNFSSVINLKLEVERILNEKQPLTVKDLEINGHDLMEVGIQPGIKMGEILNELLEEVLTNPNINSKEILLNLVKENYCSPNI
jgi:tRNA nucleotidyltransferase (CCA-adding enzyme)